MQIRNSAGAIATPIEELAILKQYVASKWEGPAVISPPQPGPPGIPFSVCDLERALSRIPVGKAVAHPFAHGLTWRTHATILAPYIFDILHHWWNQSPPYVPSIWRDGWLLLIAKPLKTPSHPKFLRPLAMTEPVGKCVLGLVTALAKDQTHAEFIRWPLWAYLEGRLSYSGTCSRCIHRHVRGPLRSHFNFMRSFCGCNNKTSNAICVSNFTTCLKPMMTLCTQCDNRPN